ncbi:MAG: glycosyltransferase [Candidatus Velthaea sp.]
MKRTLVWHRRHLALVPPPRTVAGGLRPAAVKFERVVTGGVARATFDVVLRDDAGYWPVLFTEYDDTHMRFSSAYKAFGPELTALAERLEPLVDAVPAGSGISIQLFDDDGVLAAAASGGPVVAGITAFERLVDAADRWRALVPIAAGRDVVDCAGESGYGEHVVLPFVRTLRPASSGARGDLAVALGLSASAVDAALQRTRAAVVPGGIVALGACGEDGAAALRTAGLQPRRVVRAAGDALPALDEFVAYDPPAMIPERPIAERTAVALAERPLRVVFALRGSAQTTFGGDVVQVRQTAAELRRRGHRVDIVTEADVPRDGFDIIHLTNLTVPPDTLAQARSAETFAGAVVMMPIFTDHADETVWGMTVTPQLFVQSSDETQLGEMLEHLAARRIQTLVPHHGGMVGPPVRIDLIPGYAGMQAEICRRVDYMIANAHSEMHRVYRYLDATIPYAVAPSAADPALYRPAAAGGFRERYRLGEYVLVTGRFEGRKNQLLLAHALRESGKTVVMIGKNYEAGAGAVVRAFLPPNVIVFNEMPEEELAGAIAAARVVALPSWDEVVSLSALNAAACGTSLVLTRNSYEHEYLRDDAEYCDPGNWRSIASAVDRAWDSHDARAARRAALSDRVRRDYTWERSAIATEEAYYRVLASNPRGDARRARYGAAS